MQPKQTKLEVISSILQKKYREDKPDCEYPNCVVDEDSKWNYDLLYSEYKGLTKYKNKKFSIRSIDPVKSEIVGLSSGALLTKGRLHFRERTGLFKMTFNDSSFMYVAKWYSGAGKFRTVESIFCAENRVWTNFLKMFDRIQIKKIKPKIGLYLAIFDTKGIIYNKLTKIPNNTIFHNELPKIKDSVNYYFTHVSDFMKYNQSGRRTILLYGEPGTSKTSTLYQLALEHKNNKSVIFSTDINTVIGHVLACEKYSIPTIVCFEDCESIMQYNDSGVKSFLSGISAGRNKNGTCIMLTTNYPGAIEDSIKERPERIDELHYIGPIEGDLLIKCAEFYFGEFLPKDLNLKNILQKPMTGAEVKLMVDNTLKYCASFQKEINEESIRTVLSKYRSDIVKLQKFSNGKGKRTYVKSAGASPMGFHNTSSEDSYIKA